MLVAMVMKYKDPASILTSLATPHNANTTWKLYKPKKITKKNENFWKLEIFKLLPDTSN
jgi:hypothetical protein